MSWGSEMRPLAIVGALAAALAIGGAAGWTVQGWRMDAELSRVAAAAHKSGRELAEAALELERETRRAVDAITINSRKEKDFANANINRLRADLRAGNERLSVAVASCEPAGDPGSGHPEARADILPATADRIVEIIGDADRAVLDLNECIDKYSAVRRLNQAEQ